MYRLLMIICLSLGLHTVAMAGQSERLSDEHAHELALRRGVQGQAVVFLEMVGRAHMLHNYPSFRLTDETAAIIRKEAEEFIWDQQRVPNSATSAYAKIYPDYVTEQEWRAFEKLDERGKTNSKLMKKITALEPVVTQRVVKEWMLDTYVLSIYLRLLERRFNLSASTP